MLKLKKKLAVFIISFSSSPIHRSSLLLYVTNFPSIILVDILILPSNLHSLYPGNLRRSQLYPDKFLSFLLWSRWVICFLCFSYICCFVNLIFYGTGRLSALYSQSNSPLSYIKSRLSQSFSLAMSRVQPLHGVYPPASPFAPDLRWKYPSIPLNCLFLLCFPSYVRFLD